MLCLHCSLNQPEIAVKERHETNTREVKSSVEVVIPGHGCGCMFFARSARQTDTSEPKSARREESAASFTAMSADEVKDKREKFVADHISRLRR